MTIVSLAETRAEYFSGKSCVRFKKSQSSVPTDLHLAERQKRFQVSAAGLEQQRIEAQKMLANLVPPPVDRAAER